jgi:hypothetical protein
MFSLPVKFTFETVPTVVIILVVSAIKVYVVEFIVQKRSTILFIILYSDIFVTVEFNVLQMY